MASDSLFGHDSNICTCSSEKDLTTPPPAHHPSSPLSVMIWYRSFSNHKKCYTSLLLECFRHRWSPRARHVELSTQYSMRQENSIVCRNSCLITSAFREDYPKRFDSGKPRINFPHDFRAHWQCHNTKHLHPVKEHHAYQTSDLGQCLLFVHILRKKCCWVYHMHTEAVTPTRHRRLPVSHDKAVSQYDSRVVLTRESIRLVKKH